MKAKPIKVILQNEVSECGLACIAMIAGHFGKVVDIFHMRSLISVGVRGMNFNHLISVSHRVGLIAKPIKVEMNLLDNVKVPLIAHWNFDHFVVVEKLKKESIIIIDPAIGRREVSFKQFSESFTGLALEFNLGLNFSKKSLIEKFSLIDFFKQSALLPEFFIKVSIISLILFGFSFLTPLYIQFVVDSVAAISSHAFVVGLTLGFILLTLVEIFATWFRGWTVSYFVSAINLDISTKYLSRMLLLPQEWFDSRMAGDILSKYSSLSTISQICGRSLVESMFDGLVAIFILVIFFSYDFNVASVILGLFLAHVFIRWWILNKLELKEFETIVARSKEQSAFLESIRAIASIRNFNRQSAKLNSWQKLFGITLSHAVASERLKILSDISEKIYISASFVSLVYLSSIKIVSGELTVGMTFAFLSWFWRFTAASSSLLDKTADIYMLRIHINRTADIALTQEEEYLFGSGCESTHNCSISCKGLSFRYSESEPWIFRNIDIAVSEGENVVIVGPSGCGKSTFLKVLAGNISACEGVVLFGKKTLKDIGLVPYREKIACIMQGDRLLSGTVAANVAFFSTNYSDEKVKRCLEIACVLEEVEKMNMGINTIIFEGGGGISGGQAQRILLARALYIEPSLMFLDEATSHLDRDTEVKINKNLAKLNITLVTAAHRAETIAFADRVIDFGRLNLQYVEN
jgi:ATP-binding cassette, subfamily B, bacterial CvaB/MchF/RaxB